MAERTTKRLIKEVIFERLGPLSARELLSMPREGWETLRAGITDHHNGKPGLVARCVACQGRVFISTANGRPLFNHYQGADERCPWYTGKNIHPNDARAEQYHGQQESAMHRRMCELIAQICKLDDRCKGTKIDEYRPPTQNDFGRYPDVLVDWQAFGEFAVEYQMSHTFQTEVSQRCIHYEREGIRLLWILSSFDPNHIPQAVSDVVHRHRGNAFVLDQAAIAESFYQKTLILNCFLSNGDGFDPPSLVRFDSLTFHGSSCPFLEDRLVQPLLEKIAELRLPYFNALRSWGNRQGNLPLDDLIAFEDRRRIQFLVAAAFSIVEEAACKPDRKPRNYASEHLNIKAMINTYQNSGLLAPYARLLTTLIKNTAQRDLLNGTVGDHLRRSIDGHRLGNIEQVDEKSPEWRLMRELFPEALDPFVRERLIKGGALPFWAR